MILEWMLAFLVGAAAGFLASFGFLTMIRRRLYNLEVDVADLQERHLRSVRKAAAKERWEIDDNLDDKIIDALKPQPKKGWTKWPSSAQSGSSSETSPSR